MPAKITYNRRGTRISADRFMQPRRRQDHRVIAIGIFAIAVALFGVIMVLCKYPMHAGAQAQSIPCGNIELILEDKTDELNSWTQCNNEILEAVGNCDFYQAFELTAIASKPATIHYEWYCNPSSYITKVNCWDFPGYLHFRVIGKEGKTIEEWICPNTGQP